MKEPNIVQLKIWDKPMGRLAYRSDDQSYALALDPLFIAEGHDLSPLKFPASEFTRVLRVFTSNDSPFPGGLPGLIADSLPDTWGDQMLRREMPGIKTLVGKLAAIGSRGFGAITYSPVLGSGADTETVEVNLSEVAKEAGKLMVKPLTEKIIGDRMRRALTAGASLGGAQAKISAHLPMRRKRLNVTEVLVGGSTPKGHAPCIVKLTYLPDEATGAVEYAYSVMARKAGIQMADTALVNDGKTAHFACARFDRTLQRDGSVQRWHCHTLSGLLHRRAADGAIDYEDFMRLTKGLTRSFNDAEQCFRRAVFNLLALNRDDHGRNHAFMYDEMRREWSLAPAYDLNPSVANVLIGLSWLGSRAIPRTFDEVARLAELGGLDKRLAKVVFQQVEHETLGSWRRTAKAADVPPKIIDFWEEQMLSQTRELRSGSGSV
jgi:serine/threonine-protein kinase HipA